MWGGTEEEEVEREGVEVISRFQQQSNVKDPLGTSDLHAGTHLAILLRVNS